MFRFDKDVAIKNAKINIIGTHSLQQTARMASDGHYTSARLYNYRYDKFMSKSITTPTQKKQYSMWRNYGTKIEDGL